MSRSFFYGLASWVLPLLLPGLLSFGIAESSSQANELKGGDLQCSRLPASVALKSQGKPGALQITAKSIEPILKRGGVFIFYDPACPICAEYFPTIEKLAATYSRWDFYLVFRAGVTDSAQDFVRDYSPRAQILLDDDALLQLRLSATVTPQVFFLNDGKIVYSGRIDDRYESIGHRRSVIRSYDLRETLDKCRQGERSCRRTTVPVGCFLENTKFAGGECHGCKQ